VTQVVEQPTVLPKKTKDSKYWQGCGESIIEKVWRFLKKLKNRTIIRSSNPTTGYISKGNESNM
jgi:hypothetical protein